jgi:hypothetical protein
MWTALRIGAGLLALAVFGVLVARQDRLGPSGRVLRSPGATVALSIGLPLLAIWLLLGSAAWKVLVAGWIWLLAGVAVGLIAVFLWGLLAGGMRGPRREVAERVIFWVFFFVGGLGVLILVILRWMQP